MTSPSANCDCTFCEAGDHHGCGACKVKVKYARPPFPPALYARFTALASKLGYTVRGQKWKLLDLLMAYAETHSDLFRKR